MFERLDHLVLAGPDLAAACALFADLSGVTPAPGGRHVGLGTANALVGLGGSSYLEIVGPDPSGAAPERRRPFGVDELLAPRLVTWALRSRDLDADLSAARRAGLAPGPGREMSRRTLAGELLRWRLTLAPDGVATGSVPFLIDWSDAPHPASAALPVVQLTTFELHSPEPDRLRAALSALSAQVPVVAAVRAGLLASLATPRGTVVLR